MDECIMHICVCLCACSLTFNISFFLRSLPKGKSSARGRVARRNEEILSIALSLSLPLSFLFSLRISNHQRWSLPVCSDVVWLGQGDVLVALVGLFVHADYRTHVLPVVDGVHLVDNALLDLKVTVRAVDHQPHVEAERGERQHQKSCERNIILFRKYFF